ncbi:MAG: hydrogenase maturation protease [Eggerthellaceae bacterium]
MFCVGNKLMLDDGVGLPCTRAADAIRYSRQRGAVRFGLPLAQHDRARARVRRYHHGGCIDGTDADPGTVFRFEPDAMARHSGATASLHDLKLVDLFDAAALLGYEAEGLCLGMQVENPSPAVVTVGLTPKVDAALPLLVETVAGELARLGSPLRARA